ncbi:MAG: hypothetical protein GXY87_06445 [Tissierellia bacterium]|nr:hypothetical protein [Tissierellia bacterium]
MNQKRKMISNIFRDWERNKRKVDMINMVLGYQTMAHIQEREEEYYFKSAKRRLRHMKDEKALFEEKKRLDKQIYLRDIMYKLLSDGEKNIIYLKFEKRYSVLEILDIMYISQATYYRKLNGIYDKLAIYYYSFEDLFSDKKIK